MQVISSIDAASQLPHILQNVQLEPVMIRDAQQDVAVLISPREYQKLRQINLQKLNDICERASAYAKSQGLTEELLAQMLAEKE